MIDYNDEIDKNWMRRLEHQRSEDRKAQARADRVERIVMTLLWAFGLTVIVAAEYWLGTMKRGQATSLMIVVPAASPSPSPTPEPEAESTFGTPQGASIIASTEPPTLRTVQNHPPSASPRKAGATTYDSTVRRSKPYPALGPLPRRDSRSAGNAASQGLPMRLGVTGWRDSHSDIMEPSKGGPWHRFLVTGYSHGCTNPRSGKEPKRPQRQSSGSWPVANWTVAAPPDMVPGTVIELSYRGILTTRIVGDTGPDIVRKPGRLPRLDLFMENCERANAWGHHVVDVREIRRPMGGRR